MGACPHAETTLSVKAVVLRAANTSRFRSTWNPGVFTDQNTADNKGNAFFLCCNSVKLRLTAIKLNSEDAIKLRNLPHRS